MLMFYLTHYLRVEFIIWHNIKYFEYGHVPLIIEGMYLYICIYRLCILWVTYTYMTSKLLKDVTVL